MKSIKIGKGRDIPLKGEATTALRDLSLPGKVVVPFFEFRLHQFRLLVKEGDHLLVGTPIAEARADSRVVLVSPVSGAVEAVNRGEKRLLLSLTIKLDGLQHCLRHSQYPVESIAGLSRDEVLTRLLIGGLWPFFRQRPFGRIADPKDVPKSIFVRAVNTDPLAPDIDVLLEQGAREFQAGLDVLCRLTNGPVYLCFAEGAKTKALTGARNVECVSVSGPHPAGNVGTHIHQLDPLAKGEVVWYLEAVDVVRVARLFLNGVFDPHKIVAITGEGAFTRSHVRTIIGASVSYMLGESKRPDLRYISGSVLSGTEIGYDDSVGIYDSQLTVIPAGGVRKFLGWAGPRFDEYSFSRMIGGGFLRTPEVSLDTDTHGSLRAVVMNDIYDDLNALDVLTFFLIRAIRVGEVEEMIKLGILECAPEDFALCSFACPSKIDVPGIIRQGLELMEKEA